MTKMIVQMDSSREHSKHDPISRQHKILDLRSLLQDKLHIFLRNYNKDVRITEFLHFSFHFSSIQQAFNVIIICMPFARNSKLNNLKTHSSVSLCVLQDRTGRVS